MEKMCVESNADRLSSLPDSLVEHILSFLPTLDAVRTILISKRFGNSWTWIHSLDFEEEVYGHPRVGWNVFEGRRFCSIIAQILKLLNRPEIELLRLRCFVRHHDQTLRSDVGTWLQFLLADKQLKTCDLQFGTPRRRRYSMKGIVPQCTFYSHSLTELRLSHCTIKLEEQAVMISLKKMSFDSVFFEEKALENTISGCPLLEELHIAYCSTKMSSLKLTSHTVRKLSLKYPLDGGLLEVKCPNLSSLYLLFLKPVELLDISSIMDAKIFMFVTSSHQFKSYMEKVQYVDTVTINECVPAMYAYLMKENLSCPNNDWKSIKVVGLDQYRSCVSWISCLLRFSSCLEELLIDDDPCYGHLPTLTEDDCSFFAEANFGNSLELDCICLRKHLRKVVLRGYTWKTYKFVILLSEIILKNAWVLEELVIEKFEWTNVFESSPFACPKRVELSKALSSISKRSTRAKVHFVLIQNSRNEKKLQKCDSIMI